MPGGLCTVVVVWGRTEEVIVVKKLPPFPDQPQ